MKERKKERKKQYQNRMKRVAKRKERDWKKIKLVNEGRKGLKDVIKR